MNLSARFSNARHVKHVIASAIVCSMLLSVLPGCHIIPILRDPAPAPPLPESIKGETSAENSSQLGIDEFYNDRALTNLIHQGLAFNRELKILTEEVQIAQNEVLARTGAYLPFVTTGAGAGLNRFSQFTLDGASLRDDAFAPGKFFPNPMGNFLGGVNLTWRLDIYRQLRNARDAAARRYVAAFDRRSYFVTHLIAEIAQNYYDLISFDKRLENLDRVIELNENSLKIAQARLIAARGTLLAVQRFEAEVRKNQSQKLIVKQDIIEAENRINFLVNRYPVPVERAPVGFSEYYDLKIHDLSAGLPLQLLQNRPDIRQAERDLEAAGLDVQVARVNFYPQLALNGGVALQAYSFRYLFEPAAVVGSIAGGLVGPMINFRAIQADYLTANARQLQSVYNYQRVILEAFTEVITRLNKVENYSTSIEIKKRQVERLVASVETANRLFQQAQTEYIDVLFAQRDLWDARAVLIETKQAQLNAVISTYQALGGGWERVDPQLPAWAHGALAPHGHGHGHGHAPAMPALAPNDPANPGPQPGVPGAAQPGPAPDLPPALP
jgi:outer membrane protein, multidrug efflux system